MPRLSTIGAASVRSFGRAALEFLKVQDVFATSLYTGNGGSQSISNGLNIAGRGGLVWLKDRSASRDHYLYDTVRGVSAGALISDLTAAQQGTTKGLTAFNSDGFSITNDTNVLSNLGDNYVSWSFLKAAKFLDVVTWTGDGTSARNIPHSLGITPGFYVMKATSTTSNWIAIARDSDGVNGHYLQMNTTAAQLSGITLSSFATTTLLKNVDSVSCNASGVTYVAYVFAHDPDTTNGIIQCGSFTTRADGSTASDLVFGWQPQFFLVKRADAAEDWTVLDTSRGWGAGADAVLKPNLGDAESSVGLCQPSSTGVTSISMTASASYIYMAIRKGPM